MGIFLSGFAEIDITPPPGCELTGYAVPGRLGEGVHDPLKAVAVVLDDRRQKSVLCAVDLCVIHEDVTRNVRARVSSSTAIPPERILIAATHTHSGPKLMNSELAANQRWVRELENRLIQVMMMADYHRVPASIATGSSVASGVGGNRRRKDGPVDSSVSVLRVDGEREGYPLGVVVNVSLHPTVLGPDNRQYSADFVGALRDVVREKHGSSLPVVCFNGACGDVNPGGYSPEASLRGEDVAERTFERAADIGRTYGMAVFEALVSASKRPDPRVEAEARNTPVKLRPFPLPAEAKEQLRACEAAVAAQPEGTEEYKQAKAECIYAEQMVRNAEVHARSVRGWMDVPLQVFSVSDWALIGFPTEVFAAHGMNLKRQSPFASTMVAAYANASLGYLPDQSAIDDAGYEQRMSLFGPWAVESVLGEASMLLQSVWERQQRGGEREAIPATPVEVRPELKMETTEVGGTCVPAIDFHLHWWTHWHTFDEVLSRMDRANVRYGVTLIGDVFPEADMRPVLELMKPVRHRFFYFTGVDFANVDSPDWGRYVRSKLEQDVELGAKGIKLYKDLGLSYTDRAGRLLRPIDPRVRPLWEAAADLGLPVLYHVADPPAFFQPVEPSNERYEQLRGSRKWWWGRPGYPSYDQLIDDMFQLAKENHRTTFVFPHCASLSNDLRRCGELIRSSDNIYVDLSARLPQIARQPYRAHDFCVEHADRVIFGTDDSLPGRNNVYELWIRLLETRDEYFAGDYYGARVPWRFYGLDLPKQALQKIYWDNAARLLGLDAEGGSTSAQ